MIFSGRLVLIRHGQTEWSVSGQHTGHTDIPLTDQGRAEAEDAKGTLGSWDFSAVYSSPLRRAAETAEIVGLAPEIVHSELLEEWDYGEIEGRTTEEFRRTVPDWSVWTHHQAAAETVDEVGGRVDRFFAETLSTDVGDVGDVAVFAHGHLLAILIARWLDFPAIEGRRFKLQTATVSLVDYHRGDRVLRALNHRCGQALHS